MRDVRYTLLLCLCVLNLIPFSVFAATQDNSNFRDFGISLMNANFLTQEEKDGKLTVTFGVAIAEDGTATRVDADDASANIVLQNFKYHSDDHGFNPGTAVVPVNGMVKITYGACAYGNEVKVKDANGAEVAALALNSVGGCYHQQGAVVEAYYRGEATTLSMSGGGYISYIAIEATDEAPATAEITFGLGAYESAGIAPAGETVQIGDEYTLPLNRQMYVDGQTLTAWTDGTNNFAPGATILVEGDLALTPVFTANQNTLAERTEPVTITWDFQRKNGAPLLAIEGKKAIYVSQAVVNGETIDVKIDLDTTTGKIANGNWTDWAQMNAGTTLTFPAAKNCVVVFQAYNAPTTTTVAGDTGYTVNGTIATYTYGGSDPTIDIVIGDGSYYRYFTITYPEATSNIQERPVIYTDFNDWDAFNSKDEVVSVEKTTAFSNETVTFSFDAVNLYPNMQQPDGKFTYTGYVMAEKNREGLITTSAFQNITRVRYLHGATGSNRGFRLEKKADGDADWVVLSDAVANPSSGVWVECNVNGTNVQLRWSNLNQAQNAYMFELEVLSNVEITAPQVTLSTNVYPEEAGSIMVTPASAMYDEGTEITLTAKRNFGYEFLRWEDGNGAILSTDEVYNHVLNENLDVTAIFGEIATYSLSTSVEGGANSYMILATPDANKVDGKNMYEVGTIVTLTAIENPVIKFTNWATGETTNEITTTMDSDKSFTAHYSAGDYVVGWDFFRRGANGRPADFASTADNEATTLVLRTAAGQTNSWLDKSEEAAGGYEGEPAAVNWKPIADKYYFETKVVATDFTDIKVTSKMLYNYNAYSVQKLEYSLDGENYVEAARITIPGGKVWTPLEATLPAECNHAPTLHLRWIPDYESEIVGSESVNDGTAITAIYVTGSPQIYDDGTAPVLVNSIPANNAGNISATGRIVLTFDEKVQLAEGTVATLGDKTLNAVIAGKTMTFSYMGLNYNTDYTFTLAANTVADMAGNTMTSAININFTTMEAPVVTPGMYDAVVTTAEEFLAALRNANNNAASGSRYRIFLHDGLYDIGDLVLTEVKSNISLIGESMENTMIMNAAPVEGISVSATLLTTGENIYMQDITLKNNYDYTGTTGRAVCLQDKGNKNVFKNVAMLSFQDTYYSNNNRMRSYFEDSKIHGTVDFICGGGDVFFNRTTLFLEDRTGNVITAPAGDTDWGYVFNDCIIDGYESNKGSYALGRPWQGAPMSVWINTTMKVLPKAEGWNDMSPTIVPKLFAEYNSHTENGMPVDCSARKTEYLGGTIDYSPVLTAEEAAAFTLENVLGGNDAWQPAMLTEQALAPVISENNGTISWAESTQVFVYAVCKNGQVVDFTNDNSYSIPSDATQQDVFSIRAANEMGGLGLASNGVTLGSGAGTGIEDNAVAKEVAERQYFNASGIRIAAPQAGVNIVRIIYVDGSVETVKEFVK